MAADSDEDTGVYNPDEKVPLLAESTRRSREKKETPKKRGLESIKDGLADWKNSLSETAHTKDQKNKVIYYDQDSLLSWRTAMSLGHSALGQWAVIWTMCSVLLMAILSATVVVSLVPDAHKINTKRFNRFLILLKVFISFMLSIYVQQSFKRWQATLMEFQKYLTSIKQMVFLFHSIKVSQDVLEEVQRRSIAASYLLNAEIISLQQMNRDSSLMRSTLDEMKEEKLLESEEVAKLGEVLAWKQSTKSFGTLAVTCTVWAWIGEIISQTRLEGGQAIAPPMHVRVLTLCQSCMGRMEELKMNVVTQMPHAYAQLLTFLVYTNNLLLAICCGITIGSCASEAHMRNEQLAARGAEDSSKYKGRMGEFYEAIQTTGVQVVILLLEPVLYVAFLNIGHILCYPFGSDTHNLPTEGFIRRLHVELLMLVEGRKWSKERRRKRLEPEVSKDADIEAGGPRVS